MMKKTALIGLAVLLILSATQPVYGDTALRKLGRGVCNVLTCPFEVLEQTRRVNSDEGPFAAMTYGAVKGVVMTGVRAIVGVYEVATFPIPYPKKYEPILKDPEFFSEEIVW